MENLSVSLVVVASMVMQLIKMEPLEKGKGIELENKIVGGSIPKEFIKPTFDGIKEAALSGVVAGYPVIDFKITLYDGSFHDVDSSEMAFKMAGIFAFKDAMKNANPILLGTNHEGRGLYT